MAEDTGLKNALKRAWREVDAEVPGRLDKVRLARISDDQVAVRAHHTGDEWPAEFIIYLRKGSE